MNNKKMGTCIGMILLKYIIDIGSEVFLKYAEVTAIIRVDGIEKNGYVRYTLLESLSEGIHTLPNPIDPIYLYTIIN
jgi:hypothetical protein